MSQNIKDRIKALKTSLKKSYNWTDEDVSRWWFSKNPLFNERTPEEMTSDPRDFKKMETLIRFSTLPPRFL